MDGTNPQSGTVAATGPVYTMPAPAIGTNPIPIDGSSTVTMSSIYKEATGAYPGNENFTVTVLDEDDGDDNTLDEVSVQIARTEGCFLHALIGPPATAPVGTLTNPAPGGGWSRGRAEAQRSKRQRSVTRSGTIRAFRRRSPLPPQHHKLVPHGDGREAILRTRRKDVRVTSDKQGVKT